MQVNKMETVIDHVGAINDQSPDCLSTSCQFALSLHACLTARQNRYSALSALPYPRDLREGSCPSLSSEGLAPNYQHRHQQQAVIIICGGVMEADKDLLGDMELQFGAPLEAYRKNVPQEVLEAIDELVKVGSDLHTANLSL
jgi:hypothetical protein